jgi:ethanolamine ammonia-lyase large subunit
MTSYRHTIGQHNYVFKDLKDLMAKASPARSGDSLAGLGAVNAQERVAAQMSLADVPLKAFLNDLVIPYECDEITRLIIDSHDAQAF